MEMNSPSPATIQLSGPMLLLVFAAVLTIAVVLFVYRRTNPVVAHAIRYLLIALRTLAILALLLVLYQVRLQYRWTETHPPVLAVVIDQSASMACKDPEGSRSQHLQKVLREQGKKLFGAPWQTRYYRFASQAHAMNRQELDSLTFTGDATNITRALQTVTTSLAEENLGAILLFTDGNYSEGGNPIRHLSQWGIPIYTVGVGSPVPAADIRLAAIDANPFAYSKEATPVQVTVHSEGYTTLKPKVTLLEGDEVAASADLAIAGSPSDQTVTLSYTPQKEGRHKLVVAVSPQADERSLDNNRRTLYIDVFKSRTQILLLSGPVSADVAFFKQALSGNMRFQVQTLVEQPDGTLKDLQNRPATLDSLADTDILAVMNFPTSRTPAAVMARIAAAWNESNRPIIVFSGSETAFSKLSDLQHWLPMHCDITPSDAWMPTCRLTAQGQVHPLMQISTSSASASAWSMLPPVVMHHRVTSVWPNAEILAVAEGTGTAAKDVWPMIIVRSDGVVKSAAIMAGQLWRWQLMMAGIDNEDHVFQTFVNNLVRWIQTEKRKEMVNLTLDKSAYHLGEPVQVQVAVYDTRFNPVQDAQVPVTMQFQTKEVKQLATPSGNGRYETTFYPDQPGDYKVTVQPTKAGQSFGNATSLFSVGEYSSETAVLDLQRAQLQQWAHLSGGHYAPLDSASSLAGLLPARIKTLSRFEEMPLWNHYYLLLFILCSLTLEWALRKWKGMI
jgi:hypothetical protein